MKNIISKNKIIIALFFLISASCAPEKFNNEELTEDTKEVSSKVIYGSDGRLDLYQVSDERLTKMADSTVALFEAKDIKDNGLSAILIGKNFGSTYNLCSTEKFREQNSAAFCSGSLVADDIIITAGHCIETQSDCNNTRFVFGFAMQADSVLPTQVSSNEVYKCGSIIKQVLTGNGADYAVIKLDRKVLNHKPLPIRRSGEISIGENLVVIGHPAGLPTKITTGGKVRSIASNTHIVANVDTYGGNSGSAVFNLQTGVIEGILVRGENDFIRQGSCNVSNICTDGGCRGEDITRISLLASYIPQITDQEPEQPTEPTQPVLPNQFESTVNLNIPDRSSLGISDTLEVTTTAQDRLILVHLNISHTYIGDLVVKLTAPSGKTVTLHSRAGGSSDDIKKIYYVTSAFKDEKAGKYSLKVQDLATRDIGTLNSWAIEFKK